MIQDVNLHHWLFISDIDSIDAFDDNQSFKLEDLEFLNKNSNNTKAVLGKGSYGEVELALHKVSGQKLAIKKIDKLSLRS